MAGFPSDLDELRWNVSRIPGIEHPVGAALINQGALLAEGQACDAVVGLLSCEEQAMAMLQFIRLVQARSPGYPVILFIKNSWCFSCETYLAKIVKAVWIYGLQDVQTMVRMAFPLLALRHPGQEHRWLALLSPREREVLWLFSEGKSAKEVSYQLVISTNTVASHRKSLYLKSGTNSIQQLIVATSRTLVGDFRIDPRIQPV